MSNWRGNKFGGLSATELDEFLQGPWLARLACLKPDGWPYVVPVWYHWDGEAFWVVGRARSEWCHYMAADPRVSLVVDEPTPPIRKVICEGLAEVVEESVGRICRPAKNRCGTKWAKNTPARATSASARRSIAAR